MLAYRLLSISESSQSTLCRLLSAPYRLPPNLSTLLPTSLLSAAYFLHPTGYPLISPPYSLLSKIALAAWPVSSVKLTYSE